MAQNRVTALSASRPIRLVVSDVDGTIVGGNKDILPETAAAAQRLKSAQIALSIVSSRPPRGMEMVRQALGLTGPIAGFNGGIIRDGNNLLAEHLVPEDAARDTIEFFEEKGVQTWLFADDEWLVRDGGGDYIGAERHTVQFDPRVVEDFSPYIARCGKIVGVSRDFGFLEKCEDDLSAVLSGRASAHRSQQYYLDINHPRANKGAALRQIAEYYGVGLHEVAAIGDMTNDIPMLREAGLGIAMGNAPPAVVSSAHVQTGPNTVTGWADAIDNFILPKDS